MKVTFFGDSKIGTDVGTSEKGEVKTIEVAPKPVESSNTSTVTVSEAFKEGLSIKKIELSSNSYRGYVSHVNRFEKWLKEKEMDTKDISVITKRVVIEYLNSVLKTSSSRNRNNVRASLSSLFKTLEDNEVIKDNFILKINKLRSIPTRNKSYTPEQKTRIIEYMKKKRSFTSSVCLFCEL